MSLRTDEICNKLKVNIAKPFPFYFWISGILQIYIIVSEKMYKVKIEKDEINSANIWRRIVLYHGFLLDKYLSKKDVNYSISAMFQELIQCSYNYLDSMAEDSKPIDLLFSETKNLTDIDLEMLDFQIVEYTEKSKELEKTWLR